jgi:hypothetical protein
MEAILWICKGDKEKTEKQFEKLKDEIKHNYDGWSGLIGCNGDDNSFIIFVEYGTIKDEQKESLANAFTDLISGIDIELLH